MLRPRPQMMTESGIDVGDLFRTQRTKLVSLASAITLDRDVAEEVVQDAFANLQRRLDRVDDAERYLHRSVVNLSISVIRRRRLIGRQPRPPVLSASAPEVDETWQAVTNLPPRQRAVVVLRFWQDQPVDAIAETLGWPAGSVKSTLHRALKRLEEELR
jgi:RNA polymerase sigma factor (sigma-70 family)